MKIGHRGRYRQLWPGHRDGERGSRPGDEAELRSVIRRLASRSTYFAVLVLLLGYGSVSGSGPGRELDVTFQPLMDAFPLRGPILVEVVISNLSDEPKELDLGPDRKGAYEFRIVSPSGKRSKTTWRHEGGIFDPGDFYLDPGARYRQVLVLNDRHSFGEVGVYEVTARVSLDAEGEKGPAILAKEFAVTVEENRKELVGLCSRLAKWAMKSEFEEAALGSSALSYVEDPLCIPFMEQALEKGRPLADIFEGLGRIATVEAVEILERFLRRSDFSTHQSASKALREVARRTEDERVRERVEVLLQEVPPPEISIEPPPR